MSGEYNKNSLIILLIFCACVFSACEKNIGLTDDAEPTAGPIPTAIQTPTDAPAPTAAPAPTTEESPLLTEPPPSGGMIYLYGETHGKEEIIEKEFEIWSNFYHKEGLRHLFVERSYFTAEFLNIWMKADDDAILDAVYNDWAGTAGQVPAIVDFYRRIKKECPETVFHGTDIGHQFNSTGERYLTYLRDNGMRDTEEYAIASENITQGETFYRRSGGSLDGAYREDKMTQNFIREFDKLNGESVMGIYGAAHTGVNDLTNGSETHPSMANQLYQRYGDNIRAEDISYFAALRTDILTVDGKEYEASYFGEEDTTHYSLDFAARAFWRLENAYEDFRDKPSAGAVLPYNNYPMQIETGQVFVIDYTKKDGSVIRAYYRSDGTEWNGRMTTVEFLLDKSDKSLTDYITNP